MKTIRLRLVRRKFRFYYVSAGVVVTENKKSGRFKQFSNLRLALVDIFFELFGFGTGCRYMKNILTRNKQTALQNLLKK